MSRKFFSHEYALHMPLNMPVFCAMDMNGIFIKQKCHG